MGTMALATAIDRIRREGSTAKSPNGIATASDGSPTKIAETNGPIGPSPPGLYSLHCHCSKVPTMLSDIRPSKV